MGVTKEDLLLVDVQFYEGTSLQLEFLQRGLGRLCYPDLDVLNYTTRDIVIDRNYRRQLLDTAETAKKARRGILGAPSPSNGPAGGGGVSGGSSWASRTR